MPGKQPKDHNSNTEALENWEDDGGPASDVSQNHPKRKRPRDLSQAAKLVVDIASGQVEDREATPEEQGKDPAAAALGRKGGQARAESMSAKRRKEIARQAAKKRWAAK